MLSRRDFCARLLALPAITSNLQSVIRSGSKEFDTTESGFPVGDFTPFGYLDNPFHSWNLHRSGILRSSPGVGFGFYFPAGPGGYFDYAKNGIYEAHLRVGFLLEGHRFWMAEDFRAGQLSSPYHSKNIFTYAFAEESTQMECTFHQVGENALAARIAVKGPKPQSVRVLAVLETKLGGAGWWGRDGLAGEYDSADDALRIRSFAAGKVFTILGDSATERHLLGETDTDLHAWFDSGPNVEKAISYYPKPLWGALQFKLDVIPGEKTERTLILTRAENAEISTGQARADLAKARGEYSAKFAEDAAFWKTAPVLEGDWPAHWKHGWVYDFETLRMIVRRPVGNFKHPWDAMQIQAPRTVLAETSIDMLALSYADPATAKAVILGLFLNAASDNVPCAREDGEMNMVAVDGSECGTSISWCYPFFCARSIWSRTRDKQWLTAVYPHLVRLLRWTLKNRTDSEQFITGKCSWETGMDAATRFLIQQPTGGELIEFLRIVELQSAMAQAAKILGQFAEELGEKASVAEWEKTYKVYAAKTQTLWKDDWFYDFDTRNGKLVTTVSKDVGQVAPVFCEIATYEQIGKMRPTLRKFFAESATTHLAPSDDWQDELHWSSLVLPYLESLRVAGELELLSQVVHSIADRVYTGTDRRTLSGVPNANGDAKTAGAPKQKLGWPGVSCEVWGAEGAYGGEGYGWGAVLPAHIIRNLIGYRDSENHGELRLAPNLPEALMIAGKTYRVRKLQYAGEQFDLAIHVLDSRRIRVEGAFPGSLKMISLKDAAGAEMGVLMAIFGSGLVWQFEAFNRHEYLIRVAGI